MITIKNLIVQENFSIKQSLEVIDNNGQGICFVLKKNKLVGIASDGDIRRGLLKNFNLESSIFHVMNRNFVSLPVNSNESEIQSTFDESLKLIPLCDEHGNLVDVANAVKTHLIPIMEPVFGKKEFENVNECLKTGWISSQGKFVTKFESKFEDLHPKTIALAVTNGTAALHLSLVALGIKSGDEVIVPDLTFAATVNSVIHSGASPVLCEIDPITWSIDINEAQKLITPKTKAIIIVHLYGNPSNMDSVKEFVDRNNLFLIEDCAEALGSKWKNKPVGTFGDSAAFSFFANKTISTGEGGMVLFKEEKVAERAKILRDHGMIPGKKYWHDAVGFNYRLTNLQAAVGLAQIEKLEEFLEKKRTIANLYNNFLKGNLLIKLFPKDYNNSFNTFWLYTILLDSKCDRDDVIQKLIYQGIDSRPVFTSMHRMEPYKKYKTSNLLKNSLEISSSGISLPSSVNLSIENIEYICHKLKIIL